ncbi:MAG TPA: type II secretion system F family protein [Candidatus Saccharimonadia bacterium]|nr:type II secretion system F family protein [Candidatus Saccharimonadia bacterium]
MNTNSVYLSTSEKIGLISNLSTMLTAGIPILEAVDSLEADAKGNTKIVLQQMHADLNSGDRVFSTFSKFPRVFDKVTVSLVKASEEAGTLSQILKDLKDSIKKDANFTDKIKSALTYPLIIMAVFIGVLVMILIVVIPKISTVFSRLPVKLPLPTQILISLSNILLHQTIPLLLGLGLLAGGFILVYRRNRGILLAPLIRLPVISDLIRKIDLTRFAHSMYLLLSSGLPISAALLLVQDVVVRKDVSKIIAETREIIMSGGKLSEGFRKNQHVVPAIMVKLIEVGDKTGTLDKSMQDVSEYMEYEVTNQLQTITVLLEPIMLVFVGIVVGAMMLAIIAPIYGLIGQVGGR